MSNTQDGSEANESCTYRDGCLAVDCDECYASPGITCVSEDGEEIVPVHDCRIEQYREFVRQAVEVYNQNGVNP
jgi:hypothetical protein